MMDEITRMAAGRNRRMAAIAQQALACYAGCEQGASEMTRAATGRDTRTAAIAERALTQSARCSECGATGVPMVPVVWETPSLRFTCTDTRVCRWRSQTSSLERAGVLS